MNVEKLVMDKDQARDLYRSYQQHRAAMTVKDQAIAAIYKRIAAGKLVIRALASITAAGLNADGLPRLAIMRAMNDAVQFRTPGWERAKTLNFRIPLPGMSTLTRNREADVPLIPVHLRPRKALDKYHVLWEAEWSRYPVDPYLLRRFGEDAWLVVAAWELTAVERAVMCLNA
jgi:hypothetical protein